MHPTLSTILDILTIAFLLFGLFFMSVGAIGLIRFPDFYHRMHGATKCVTLGIVGLLIGCGIAFSTHVNANPVTVITSVALVIVFQFIANPVGGHLLSKAAHLDHCPYWHRTISDELQDDRRTLDRDSKPSDPV